MANVLVVDDEVSVRLTLRSFLSVDGHNVQTADDAEHALALMRENEFDVVVTDIIMPKMSGIDLLKEIRETAPHVSVVLITGEPSVETAVQALREGADDYIKKDFGSELDFLSKPFAGEDIKSVVNRVLEKKGKK